MSTYYKFYCPECKLTGGFLSRQAWGIGNFDIIATFKFLGLHLIHRPVLVDENTAEYEHDEQEDESFILESKGIFPHHDDILCDPDKTVQELNTEWENKFRKRFE